MSDDVAISGGESSRRLQFPAFVRYEPGYGTLRTADPERRRGALGDAEPSSQCSVRSGGGTLAAAVEEAGRGHRSSGSADCGNSFESGVIAEEEGGRVVRVIGVSAPACRNGDCLRGGVHPCKSYRLLKKTLYFKHAFEEDAAEVALTGIGKYHNERFAARCLFPCDSDRCRDGGSA
jgi:hypothetical protein